MPVISITKPTHGMQIMQPDGISIAWPQWLLPQFLVARLFSPAGQELLPT